MKEFLDKLPLARSWNIRENG